jgi:hypothetical protein
VHAAARSSGSASAPILDWERVLAAAAHHSVTPLLAQWVAARPELAPPEVRSRLRGTFDRNALRNVRLAQHLTELLDLLGERGLEAMPIKGPALAITAYGDLALREFSDLDILIRPGDFDAARAALLEAGLEPLHQVSRAGELTLRDTDHHLVLADRSAGVVVELHWSLENRAPGRTLDESWSWKHVRTVLLLGRELPTLSWSALLVYLCTHGSKHGWERLGWIRDVAGVLQVAPRHELAEALELAAVAGTVRRVELGVTLAHELLGAPLPEGMLPATGGGSGRLVKEVRARLFDAEELGELQHMSFQYRSRDNGADRAGYLWQLVAAPHLADVDALHLPPSLGRLYHVTRPVRLLSRRIAKSLQRRND